MKRFLATAAAALLAATLFTGQAQNDIPDRLGLGMVPSREIGTIVDSLEPIGRMLSERLLIPVDTFVSTDYPGLVEAIGTGRVDIGLFGPATLVDAMDLFGAQLILASVRDGNTFYRAQFNIRCDSGIDDFEDLRGGTIAFVSPGSASGYRFPYISLRNRGIDPDTDMTAIFAGNHDASALAVYNGDVDVGITFSDWPGTNTEVRERTKNEYPDIYDVMCVLGYSDPIPNDGAVVRAGLAPELVEQITQAMIDIANTEEGQVLTQRLFNVSEFARADPANYEIVREVNKSFGR